MPKYHNKKIKLGGHKFASKAEAARWIYLAALEREGSIYGLLLQPRYPLYAGIVYVADFEYKRLNGEKVTEDVKGFKTAVYRLKAKLFKDIYKRDIVEIKIGGYAADCLIKAWLGEQRRRR